MSTPGGAIISAEQLKSKYIGTGHADISKYEWVTNIHRDTLASHVGHFDQLSYFAVAQNESIGRIRAQLMELTYTAVDFSPVNLFNVFFQKKMIQPCGQPPSKRPEN